MKLQISQRVKCFLRIGSVIEGIIEEINDPQLVLKSLDGKSFLIIHNALQDIVLTKVLSVIPTIISQNNAPFMEIMENDEIEKVDPIALRTKSVAELKIEMAKEERQIVADKLKDHHLPDTSGKVNYGNPRFFYQKHGAK